MKEGGEGGEGREHSSPPPSRSFTCTIFRAVFEHNEIFFRKLLSLNFFGTPVSLITKLIRSNVTS